MKRYKIEKYKDDPVEDAKDDWVRIEDAMQLAIDFYYWWHAQTRTSTETERGLEKYLSAISNDVDTPQNVTMSILGLKKS